MLTETGDNAVTVAVKVLEVAGLSEVQVSDEVKEQVTRSLLAGV